MRKVLRDPSPIREKRFKNRENSANSDARYVFFLYGRVFQPADVSCSCVLCDFLMETDELYCAFQHLRSTKCESGEEIEHEFNLKNHISLLL